MCHKIVDSDNTLQKKKNINVPIEEDEDNSSNKKRQYPRRKQNNQDLNLWHVTLKTYSYPTIYVRNQPIIISNDIGIETNYILKSNLYSVQDLTWKLK